MGLFDDAVTSTWDKSGATFSPCRTYRYSLYRRWSSGNNCLAMCALNCSTADENDNDPTIERMVRRAQSMGFDWFQMVNLFAYRDTDPLVMKAQFDPIGPGNDAAILAAAKDAAMFIVGWGKDGCHRGRDRDVLKLLAGVNLWCLGTNGDGSPKHPLYLSYSVKPQLFRVSDQESCKPS